MLGVLSPCLRWESVREEKKWQIDPLFDEEKMGREGE